MLNITKSSDPIKVSTIVALIYGEPGVGKTHLAISLAITAGSAWLAWDWLGGLFA